jgi:hypothetical protein
MTNAAQFLEGAPEQSAAADVSLVSFAALITVEKR